MAQKCLCLKMTSISATSFLHHTSQWPNAQCPCVRGDNEAPDFLYCMTCDCMYCTKCWKEQHSNPRQEQTLSSDAMTIHTTLKVRLDEYSLLQEAVKVYSEKANSHRPGVRSEWFGVTAKNDAGNYMLSEGPAYEDIILEPCGSSSPITYPALVSFVGERDAGRASYQSFDQVFALQSQQHLQDARRWRLWISELDHPILYADCEGMDGDEIPAQLSSKEGQEQESPGSGSAETLIQFNPQKIDWQDGAKEGEAVSRRRITKTLFPMILYIFSDVVVYIVHNRI
ncbi:hypothetical protein XA68_12789 [Ophiocordyceps unilateralis]|uniref:Uncharacterized protein n=1 Tax=Ophiocordyceps unilateralis TaxID=268505 RepID=A0A2A9PDZ8_OPHUN|nr:hypothetical protein XA68_12789 [Ophiocordyceps unilateralis]